VAVETVPAARDRAAPSALTSVLERNVFVVLVFAVCIALQTAIARGFVADDTWYTLLGGRTILHSWLPHHDTWTVMTAGHSWVDQQWLAQLAAYGVWAAGGFALMVIVFLALFVAAFALAAAAARFAGASDRAVAVVALAGYLVGVSNSEVRAQVLAYPLFAAVLALLALDARTPSRRVYLVFPLLVLWANLHGSVVLGAALVALRGLTAVRSNLRKAGVLLVLPWPCVLVSPYGTALVGYYRSTIGSGKLAHAASEWGPTTIRAQPIFVALLLIGIWLLGRARGANTLFEQLAFAGSGLLGLYAVRYMVWFALVAIAVLPHAVDALWRPRPAARNTRVNVALSAAGLAVVALGFLRLAAHGTGWFERSYPRAAPAAAAADPGARVYANERFADWLLFERPALRGRVAYDARFELLSAAQLAEIGRFRNRVGLDWQRAVRGYRVLVLDPGDEAATIRYYRRRPGVQTLYDGSRVVVLRLPHAG